MGFPKKLKDLCTPARVYFIISMVFIILSVFQNIGNNKIYKLGSFSSDVPNTFLIFLVKLIYILFWTWILNLICKDGHSEISWFLVMVPFILLFIIVGIIMLESKTREGMRKVHKVKQKPIPTSVIMRNANWKPPTEINTNPQSFLGF